jgi:hypothetical protein
MANSSLQGYSWPIPESVHNHLSRTMSSYKGNQNVEGYQRLKKLLDDPNVSYEQLKRIKNFFDTHTTGTDYMDGKGDRKQDTEFILNGGSKMRWWVSDTLNKARAGVKIPKDAKKDFFDNQFKKTHDKNTVSTDSVKIKNPKVGSSARQVSDSRGIYEMRVLENLINIFDKNKQLCHTNK